MFRGVFLDNVRLTRMEGDRFSAMLIRSKICEEGPFVIDRLNVISKLYSLKTLGIFCSLKWTINEQFGQSVEKGLVLKDGIGFVGEL